MRRLIGLKAENDRIPDYLDEKISDRISAKTIFPSESNEMFYFVREGFQETNISEGFCK